MTTVAIWLATHLVNHLHGVIGFALHLAAAHAAAAALAPASALALVGALGVRDAKLALDQGGATLRHASLIMTTAAMDCLAQFCWSGARDAALSPPAMRHSLPIADRSNLISTSLLRGPGLRIASSS